MKFREGERVDWYQKQYTSPNRPGRYVPATVVRYERKTVRIRLSEFGTVRFVHEDNLRKVTNE